MLRDTLLTAARSRHVERLVTTLPGDPPRGRAVRARRRHRRCGARHEGTRRRRPAEHAGLPRRGHRDARAGAGDRRRVPAVCSIGSGRPVSPQHAEVSVKLSALGSGAARRGADGARARPDDLQRGAHAQHDGHARHGGPHDHRLHAARARRAPAGLPRHRRGRAVLPAPHRGRLPRPGVPLGPGSASARARTTSRPRSPTSPSATSICRTFAASRC